MDGNEAAIGTDNPNQQENSKMFIEKRRACEKEINDDFMDIYKDNDKFGGKGLTEPVKSIQVRISCFFVLFCLQLIFMFSG